MRECKLKDAIKLWNSVASSNCGLELNARAALQKNLGLANLRLADLRSTSEAEGVDHQLSVEQRAHHYRESIECLTASYVTGVEAAKPSEWCDDLLARCQHAFMGQCEALRATPLASKLALRSVVLRVPPPLQAACMTDLATLIYNHGVVQLDAGDEREAHRALKEAERPLGEADYLLRRADASLMTHRTLQELVDSVYQHACIAEARMAVAVGDRTLNGALSDGEALDMERVWTAFDKYAEAAVLTRGKDIETEAIAIARRGRVYAKVMRNESTARPLLLEATRLAATLAPRSFHGTPWYEECTKQLALYQAASYAADERAAERRREAARRSQQPTREKLKAQLDALEDLALSSSAYKLLEHVYEKYPPRVSAYTKQAGAVLARVKGASADTLKKVPRGAAALPLRQELCRRLRRRVGGAERGDLEAPQWQV